jgi:hypothetical protein
LKLSDGLLIRLVAVFTIYLVWTFHRGVEGLVKLLVWSKDLEVVKLTEAVSKSVVRGVMADAI